MISSFKSRSKSAVMYVVNSYLHVLKNIDSSWGDSSNPATSKKTSRRWRSRKLSRSSQKSRKDSHGRNFSSSSSESGLFSEELVNSGYFGDDEVERCRCQRCLLEVEAQKPKQDFAVDYDIISVDLSACETPKQQPIIYHPRTQANYNDYIIIPSSQEDFFAGNPSHSTPFDNTEIPELDLSLLLPDIPPVRVDIQNKLNKCCSRKLSDDTAEDESSSSSSPPVVHSLPNINGSERFWWRDNVLWQLQQRNSAQTKRFSQLQSDEQRCRSKVRINRELADYLNKCGDLRPQSEILNTSSLDLDFEPICRSELILAIRNHFTTNVKTQEVKENPLKPGSIANLAVTYLNRQRTLAEEKLRESEDSSSPGCGTSRMGTHVPKRSPSKKWRENIMNQLEMRNFLECKYFTDALARRAMSQINITQSASLPSRGLAEYDIITDDEVSGLSSKIIPINSTHSTSLSQGYYSSAPFRNRFFKRGKRR
ncbi:uncharacterized protein [Montipora capricornis]|uniref:uncharacterized protein isoform X2 n=1 Tax=Montipora capricornis TaxID=246305 RepID=UPI0035F2092C